MKKKRTAKKKASSQLKAKTATYITRFVAFTAIFSAIMIAATFVLGSYYAVHPESRVLSVTTATFGGGTVIRPKATPTPTIGGQIFVNFVKYDSTKKGWVYASVKTEVNLINAGNRTLEVGHVNSQGWGFSKEPLGTYYVRFNPSVGAQAVVCDNSCFSIPTTGYSTKNPVNVTLTTNDQRPNVYIKLK